ncbi:hypothetical protein EON63_11630 [archaeon]|nr:MAG: hypothetical protein EON63_11630 [archaeon]
MTIADICAQRNIHHTLYATGCIFEYDETHTIGGQGFTEEESANFHGSFYSHTKVNFIVYVILILMPIPISIPYPF